MTSSGPKPSGPPYHVEMPAIASRGALGGGAARDGGVALGGRVAGGGGGVGEATGGEELVCRISAESWGVLCRWGAACSARRFLRMPTSPSTWDRWDEASSTDDFAGG